MTTVLLIWPDMS